MPRSKSSTEKRAILLTLEPPEGKKADWENLIRHQVDEDINELYDSLVRFAKMFSSDDVPPSWRESFKNSPIMKLLDES